MALQFAAFCFIDAMHTQKLQSFFLFLFILLNAGYSGAEEFSLASSCYSSEELQQVRRWEQRWAGKRIDGRNIDLVADLLPESFVEIYKNPATWGAPDEGFYFYIAPYVPIKETPGMYAATRTHAPHIALEPDGSISNYEEVAGRPFPNPRSGLEIAWNFEFNTHGDSCFYQRTGYNIVPARTVEKVGDQDAWELFWVHRVDVDPLPFFSDNPKRLARSTFYHMHSPPEFKNTRMFNLRYIEPDKSDDAYMWFSAFRRIQRISTKQRTDSIDGTDLIYDDEYGWDGQILRNTYTWKGTKELLCARHTDIEKAARTQGQAMLNNIRRERFKTYVVDVYNKDPHYIYAKRVWYIDPETYLILWTEIFDDLGRFWKCFENLTDDVPHGAHQTKNFIVGSHYVDFQRVHAGTWRNNRVKTGVGISRDMFTIYNLQKGGY